MPRRGSSTKMPPAMMPQDVGFGAADVISGLHGVIAVLAALRVRDATGYRPAHRPGDGRCHGLLERPDHDSSLDGRPAESKRNGEVMGDGGWSDDAPRRTPLGVAPDVERARTHRPVPGGLPTLDEKLVEPTPHGHRVPVRPRRPRRGDRGRSTRPNLAWGRAARARRGPRDADDRSSRDRRGDRRPSRRHGAR